MNNVALSDDYVRLITAQTTSADLSTSVPLVNFDQNGFLQLDFIPAQPAMEGSQELSNMSVEDVEGLFNDNAAHVPLQRTSLLPDFYFY